MPIRLLPETPKRETIKKQLARLATRGLVPFWVIDNCRILLGLACVRDELAPERRDDPTEDELADALRSYLEKAVQEVESRQYRILLEIVLAIDASYLETTAKHRRTEAGKRFRPGSRAVTWGNIRQHHEPRAIDALSFVVHRDERAARGEGSGDAAAQ